MSFTNSLTIPSKQARFNPLAPKEMASFSKSVTMNQQTTCDTCIPFERCFLKYAINCTKRNRERHRLDCKVPKMKKKLFNSNKNESIINYSSIRNIPESSKIKSYYE